MALARPDSTARAAASASIGSDLPAKRRSLRSGRLTSITSTPAAMRCRASLAPTAGRFDTDLVERPEGAHPAEQLRVALDGGRERGLVEQAAGRGVEDRRHMDVEMGVDPAADVAGRRCHDGHGLSP